MSEVKRYTESCGEGGGVVEHRNGELVEFKELDAALAREAALRDELAKLGDDYCKRADEVIALQQRLTDAEKRAAVMEKALTRIAREHDCGCWPCTGSCVSQTALEITVEAMRDIAAVALKPVED